METNKNEKAAKIAFYISDRALGEMYNNNPVFSPTKAMHKELLHINFRSKMPEFIYNCLLELEAQGRIGFL